MSNARRLRFSSMDTLMDAQSLAELALLALRKAQP